jgi:predicted RNA-binding protein with PIN domain
MAEPTLYLFDGYNLLHAGSFADQRELTDALASFVALKGARGVVVWDGAGTDAQIGPLAVRYAPQADAVLERLAAEHRATEEVCLVSSDFAVRGTSGQEVQKRSSRSFVGDLGIPSRTARAWATRSTPRRAHGSSGSAAATADANICS